MAECLPECMENSTLQVELEILESIYLDELQVEHDDSGSPSRVEITLHPATADNVEAQFVRLTLSIMLPKEYPQELPSLTIQNPRGLSEQQVNSLYKSLQHLAQERQGESMLYEIIELAKDSLTHNNLPSCECAICLYPFHEMDDFAKTECYHYFHCHCLGRYIQHTLDQEPEVKGPVDPGRVETPQNEVVCPMCREPISYDLTGLLSAKPPAINEDKYKPDKAMMKWQADMAKVYKKQQSKGGIIDIEAEKNKFFIKLETPRHEGDAPSDVVPVGTEESQADRTGGEVETGIAGIGVMATVKTDGISKTGNGERGAAGTETTRPSDRKPRSAGFVPRNEDDGKSGGISGGTGKGQRRHEGERKVRSAGRGAGRYQGRRHSPRDGWRDRSKGGERRQYREGRRSPRDGEKVKERQDKSPRDEEKVKERQDRGNKKGKQTGTQATNKEPAGKREEQRPYQSKETANKGDSRKDDDFSKPDQSTSSVTENKGSNQSTRSDRRRGDIRSQHSRLAQPRHAYGEEADKMNISTSDSRERREEKGISISDSRERREGKDISTSDSRERREEKGISTSDSREQREQKDISTSDSRERREEKGISASDSRERREEKGISTSDSRKQREQKGISTSDKRERQGNSYQNGFPEPRNENRSITSISSEHRSDRYHNQQYKAREADHPPKKTQNRTRQRDWQRQNRSQHDARRLDDETKKGESNKAIEKKQTRPSQTGIRNEKDDRKWKKSDHSAAKEVKPDVRTVTNDKRHDLKPNPKPPGPPPGFEKASLKQGFTRPPPGFDNLR